MARTVESGYGATEAAKRAGITYRALDHWCRTDMIRPSVSDAKGSGYRRLYSAEDIALLRLAKEMLDAGVKFSLMRDAIENVRTADLKPGCALVISEGEVYVVAAEDRDMHRFWQSGNPFWVFPLHSILTAPESLS